MSTTRVGQRLRAQVLADAGGRCGYCQMSEEITGTPLEIDRVVPEALGGPTRRSNLWAVCRYCNLPKSDRVTALDPATGTSVSLFNPREQRWSAHFAWIDGGLRIAGTSANGRATVEVCWLQYRSLLKTAGIAAWVRSVRGDVRTRGP